MPPLRVDRTLWPAICLFIGAFLLFEFTGIDLALQDRLFDFQERQWLIDAQNAFWRALLYTGPKAVIIPLGVGLLALVLGPQKWRDSLSLNVPARRHLLIAFLTLGSVPALVGQLKATTNVFCPSETRRYGGDVPYVRVLECYPEADRPTRKGRCFPAGHASGGFALCALTGLAKTRRSQLIILGLALCIGSAMGFYQMAKGAHYLSHTVVTACLSWIGFLLWRRAFRVAFTPPAIAFSEQLPANRADKSAQVFPEITSAGQ